MKASAGQPLITGPSKSKVLLGAYCRRAAPYELQAGITYDSAAAAASEGAEARRKLPSVP